MAGIARWGAYLPAFRLDRALIGRAWDTPALPGERAVAAGDEDALTMAVEAALACLADRDAAEVDAVLFASTTSPYAEKQVAATIAGILDRPAALAADVTGSLRAATTALRQALDLVRAGDARAALVVAADMRPAEAATAAEQLFGDGAGAVLVAEDAPVEALAAAGVAWELVGPWRRPTDPFVRSFEPKLETEYGVVRPAAEAATRALERAGLGAGDLTRLVAAAPDPRTLAALARRLGAPAPRDPLLGSVGYLGAAHALVALAAALDEAAAGETLLVCAPGDGADAIVLRAGAGVEAARRPPTVAQLVASKQLLPTYEAYLRFRRLLPSDPADPRSSTVTYWRDRRQALPFEGVRCAACGTVQFPANRACVECGALDRMEPARLARRGRVFTFTLDHLVGGEYLETPVPRVVVDLEGGGRAFFEMTDVRPADVRVGMEVELTFRRLHSGAGFHNYYWKARPPRLAVVPA
jgi:hydroxymethylglutaryl-CoA synthase